MLTSKTKNVDVLSQFHPAIASWFKHTLGSPTEVQTQAWEAIRKQAHTLIAAPTGSGKTLAAFLTILNDLIESDLAGTLAPETSVLYISPLKALSNDVEKNLNRPLEEISDVIFNTLVHKINIRIAVRTGDTPASARASMLKKNPHILITTPESLFLLLTSHGGRKLLGSIKTVIIDEIHALVAEKRGAHLALSLERLEALTQTPLIRIGLSATQKPIEQVAQFLTGNQGQPISEFTSSEATFPPCTIINSGHRRKMDLQIEIPDSPLTAVMANEVWDEVYTKIEALILSHHTTLLFVNTRRLAERVAHRLSQSLNEDKVAAHHGSMSKERRFSAEQRLKSGELKVLVATASLELGIDIGSVDLVIQIACTKSISSFLQRVGRSGHAVAGIPKGRLFPLTRDELLEAAALMDAVRRGELDTLTIPEKPLDILAQQIVAETACREWQGTELFHVFKRAYPFRNLTHSEFNEITNMLSIGFTTRRGRRGSYLHIDGIHDRLRARPGAKLTALTNGGAIPDTFDYDVKLEPGNILLGSVNEDFAIDSMAGDIFQLGNNSWQILRIEGSTVRVADAHGQPPSIPFWFGEAPGRSEAFSESVSRLREEISTRLGVTSVLQAQVEMEGSGLDAPWKKPSLNWLVDEVGILPAAAEQLVDYLASAKLSLGVMPSRTTLVLERFFDEAGDMHMIVHSPFGSRINRAWGLSLRKRFCRKFNFELQAAATEEGLILSLGATHSFPLEEVFQYLRAGSVRHILIQALLDAPMFEVRWRWNATRALALQRNRNGKKVPPQLQRMAAEDLVALVFPDQKACFENIQGEREVPDHPLVRQTIEDCLHEAMDIDGLEKLLREIENGQLQLEARDLKEPSPFSQEIISARPYAFLDDAPLEERRTRAIQSRRYLDPTQASDIGRLDPKAIAMVKAEAWPQARNPDELHDALMLTGFLTDREISLSKGWREYLEVLQSENRVAALIPNYTVATATEISERPEEAHATLIWVATERLHQSLSALPHAKVIFAPSLSEVALASVSNYRSNSITNHTVPQAEAKSPEEISAESLVELIRGRLESLGPVRNIDVTVTLALLPSAINIVFLTLEQEGFILRGHFNRFSEATGISDEIEWCERRLLARIHRYTLAQLRREVEPVSAAHYQQFLFKWHGIDSVQSKPPHPNSTPSLFADVNSLLKPSGPESLEHILSTLEGFEAPAAAWESEIFPARMHAYDSTWLDLQGLSGSFTWAKVKVGNAAPIKTTPITFLAQDKLDFWLGEATTEPTGNALKILNHIRTKGASFWREILWETGFSATETRDAIAELVSLGTISSDGFRGLRALLSGNTQTQLLEKSGRWSLLRRSQIKMDAPALEAFAKILLKRYGVVFRKLADRENLMPPWRELVRAFRTLEAKGEIRGGRFVEGFYGEQFALPEALTRLRLMRKKDLDPKNLNESNRDSDHNLISLSAADPANLQGLISPSPRIPNHRKNRILFRNGAPVAAVVAGEFLTFPGALTQNGIVTEEEAMITRESRWKRILLGNCHLMQPADLNLKKKPI